MDENFNDRAAEAGGFRCRDNRNWDSGSQSWLRNKGCRFGILARRAEGNLNGSRSAGGGVLVSGIDYKAIT
ncbi:hypothetical protein K7432_014100 [Basidiobolus ranarum]|uniref:Uncharacterized protein n=1 Tax=Basidiobolus ranarum TaxID=34480 RepID=A0ABR2WI42_9FUNG